jgi:ubiquinone/menaquinone biosynthesis C-methylase UbiE
MSEIDFIGKVHSSTKRDYFARVSQHDKAEVAEVAKRFGREYWDGERWQGYGGYRYDGRWRSVAEAMVKHYGIKPGDKILDVGCGKGFLLYDFTQVVPGVEVFGLDISEYGLQNAKEEVKKHLTVGNANKLPWPDKHFDFVVSLGTLHNLYLFDLFVAAAEIERVGKNSKYIMVESYRSEREKVNLMYWQLTCECFFTPAEWEFVYAKAGYTGDHGYIFFE